MIITKNKKLNNVSMFVLQIATVIAFSFLFFNQQLVLFVKDFFNSLPFPAENLESLVYRLYGIIKLSLYEPKIIQLVIIFLQFALIKNDINVWINYISILKPKVYSEKISQKVDTTSNYYEKFEKVTYLENVRLLN